jgi:hypothetical protein
MLNARLRRELHRIAIAQLALDADEAWADNRARRKQWRETSKRN